MAQLVDDETIAGSQIEGEDKSNEEVNEIDESNMKLELAGNKIDFEPDSDYNWWFYTFILRLKDLDHSSGLKVTFESLSPKSVKRNKTNV